MPNELRPLWAYFFEIELKLFICNLWYFHHFEHDNIKKIVLQVKNFQIVHVLYTLNEIRATKLYFKLNDRCQSA